MAIASPKKEENNGGNIASNTPYKLIGSPNAGLQMYSSSIPSQAVTYRMNTLQAAM